LSHVLTLVGGVGYGLVLPIWAFLLSKVFRERADAPSGDARTRVAG
jgi:hypothetical protein